MSDNEVFILTDPFVEPTDDFLEKVLKDKFEWLKTIRKYAAENHQDVVEEWKYYNDVKQWLFRLKHKNETVCWIGILSDTFRITFYFGAKYEKLIEESDLPEKVKNEYRLTRDQKFRPISIRLGQLTDVVVACKLIDLKFVKK